MNRSQKLLEKMKVLMFKTPFGSKQKMLLTDKPLGSKISTKLLSRGVEFEIRKQIIKASNRIEPDVAYNLSNILSKKQLKALSDNVNFDSFSKEFKDDIFNATLA